MIYRNRRMLLYATTKNEEKTYVKRKNAEQNNLLKIFHGIITRRREADEIDSEMFIQRCMQAMRNLRVVLLPEVFPSQRLASILPAVSCEHVVLSSTIHWPVLPG